MWAVFPGDWRQSVGVLVVAANEGHICESLFISREKGKKEEEEEDNVEGDDKRERGGGGNEPGVLGAV